MCFVILPHQLTEGLVRVDDVSDSWTHVSAARLPAIGVAIRQGSTTEWKETQPSLEVFGLLTPVMIWRLIQNAPNIPAKAAATHVSTSGTATISICNPQL